MKLQQTIAEKVSLKGHGLHSGLDLQLTLHPGRANTGIWFVRRDGQAPVEIPARPSRVVSTSHATVLGWGHSEDTRVMTVEHILSALHALGIDNARIELDGPEVPAMDGSASAFVELVHTAGAFEQSRERAVLRMLQPVEVVDGERSIRIEPAEHFGVSYAVDFAHPAIGRQELAIEDLHSDLYVRELAGARTFGFLHEVRELLKAGLARGGSLDNTVVLDEEGVLNTDGLRWPDEFVRHKIVDLVGDLSLLGLPILGRVFVERGGHALHQMLVQELLQRPETWELIGDDDVAPPGLEFTRGAPERV